MDWKTYIGAQLRHMNDPTTDEPLLPKFDALVADAGRYAVIRLIACETDTDKQARMLAAIELWEPEADAITPEQFDRLFDTAILAVIEARNANG